MNIISLITILGLININNGEKKEQLACSKDIRILNGLHGRGRTVNKEKQWLSGIFSSKLDDNLRPDQGFGFEYCQSKTGTYKTEVNENDITLFHYSAKNSGLDDDSKPVILTCNEGTNILQNYNNRQYNNAFTGLVSTYYDIAKIRHINFHCASLKGTNKVFGKCSLKGATNKGTKLKCPPNKVITAIKLRYYSKPKMNLLYGAKCCEIIDKVSSNSAHININSNNIDNILNKNISVKNILIYICSINLIFFIIVICSVKIILKRQKQVSYKFVNVDNSSEDELSA